MKAIKSTKTMLLLFAIACASFSAFAQNDLCENNLLINGDFNSSTCDGIGTSCVPNWYIGGWSPTIFDLSSNPYAWMWSYGGIGEAIYANFNFVMGVTYDISFSVRTDDQNTNCPNVADNATTINLIATNSPGNVTPTPSGEIIFQGPAGPYLVNNTNNTWTTINVPFTPTSNYLHLWIFPYMPYPHGSVCQVEMSIDNICITEAITPPSNEGAYCCYSINLVSNGNFENTINLDFTSDYTNNPAVYPGNYSVATSAAPFNATITDHSNCVSSTQYPSNDQFLLVNGRTQQPGNPTAVIWEQTISGLDTNSTYKFCAYFKNMPQCTFDTLPVVSFEVDGIVIGGSTTISAVAADPCDWINKEINFSTGLNTSVTLQIILDQTGNGDGNDLAIDDISVSKLIDPDLHITVQHQGNPQDITSSINTISNLDDALHGSDCEYHWWVAEVTNYPSNIPPSTFESGNASGSTVGTSPWNLTTTFPDYTFSNGKLYMIGLYTPVCGCYDEGFTYQLTYNSLVGFEMTEEMKQQIIDWILNGTSGNNYPIDPTNQLNYGSSDLNIYPNPVEDSFTITLVGNSLKSVEVVSLAGQTLLTKNYTDGNTEEILHISKLASGIYLVKVYGIDDKQYTTKIVKE